MKNKVFIRLSIITLATAVILLVLFLSTKMPNEQNNGFNRHWLTTNLSILKESKVDKELRNINGVSSSNIYLSGSNPLTILALNKDFINQDTFQLDYQAPTELLSPNLLLIDSPWLHLHINNLRTVIFGQFPNQKINVKELQTEVFIRSVQISSTSLIVRVFDTIQQKQVFQKINNTNGSIIKQALIIPDQADAGFSTDGLLKYDATTAKILYVEFFKNRLFCLDTNLNLIFKGNTIDTIFSNAVQIATKETGDGIGSMIPQSARKIVNKNSFVNNGFLFVASGLKADNETIATFSRNTAIDVYSIENGKYQGSFYIPRINNLNPISLFANQNVLYVLYNGYLVLFHLPQITNARSGNDITLV